MSISFRQKALSKLTDEIGVYALCDLDEVPIYVGQSIDGIRSRVRRHLTSARSDIIANRQVAAATIEIFFTAHLLIRFGRSVCALITIH